MATTDRTRGREFTGLLALATVGSPNPQERTMATFLVAVDYYHDSEKSPHRFLMDIPDGADPDTAALVRAITGEYGIDCDEQPNASRVHAALTQAKAELLPVPVEVTDGDDKVRFAIWHHPSEDEPNRTNFGFGPDDGKSRSENVWLVVEPFKIDESLKARFDAMSKDELVVLLLQANAVRPNLLGVG